MGGCQGLRINWSNFQGAQNRQKTFNQTVTFYYVGYLINGLYCVINIFYFKRCARVLLRLPLVATTSPTADDWIPTRPSATNRQRSAPVQHGRRLRHRQNTMCNNFLINPLTHRPAHPHPCHWVVCFCGEKCAQRWNTTELTAGYRCIGRLGGLG